MYRHTICMWNCCAMSLLWFVHEGIQVISNLAHEDVGLCPLYNSYISKHKLFTRKFAQMVLRTHKLWNMCVHCTVHWYFVEKKAKFHGVFRGKFAEKSADFAGFSWEKSQNSQKNWSISHHFSGKKSNFEGFSGANSCKNRPISREISRGNFAKKQSVKNSRFRCFLGGQISLKSINFALMWPALFNVFFNRDNHLLFQQQGPVARSVVSVNQRLIPWQRIGFDTA